MRTHRRPLVFIVAATAAVGVLAAFAVAAGLPSDHRTFATVAAPVQLLISVGVPFLGAVATSALHRQPDPDARGTILRAVTWAVGFAMLGVLVTVAAVAALPSEAPGGRWDKVTLIVLGSVLVQVVAQLTGTGFGLLLGRPVLASVATVIPPLALWFLLGALAPGARPWLTPMEGANRLLAGTMTLPAWLPYAVVLSVWVVAPSIAGLRRLDPSRARGEAPSSLGPGVPA